MKNILSIPLASLPGITFLNSFLASGDFCSTLITFANSLDPDQDQQNAGPDLDQNCLTHGCYF